MGEQLDNTLLEEGLLALRSDHLVGGGMVALLHRLEVGRALDLAAAIEVEVGEDAEEPGSEVRPRGVRAPTPEGPPIGFLDKILCFLTGTDEPAGHAIDLVGKFQGLFLEADPI